MTRYKVRFNLEAGEYKGWWLVQDMIDPDNQNQPMWVNPASRSLFMTDCKLVIDNATANRICEGKSSKRACAWIECEQLQVIHPETALHMLDLSFTNGANVISFNPKLTPHWLYNGHNADNYHFDNIVTNAKTVYQYE